jgi:hypothetical protein
MYVDLYKPFKSTRKHKKYDIYVLDNNNKKKKISFGDTKYQHYFDKLGKYSHLNHNDKKRRESYRRRARGIKNYSGQLTFKLKHSPNYYAYKYLW